MDEIKYSIYVTNSPPKKTDGAVGFFAVKREITVIVFNIQGVNN